MLSLFQYQMSRCIQYTLKNINLYHILKTLITASIKNLHLVNTLYIYTYIIYFCVYIYIYMRIYTLIQFNCLNAQKVLNWNIKRKTFNANVFSNVFFFLCFFKLIMPSYNRITFSPSIPLIINKREFRFVHNQKRTC